MAEQPESTIPKTEQKRLIPPSTMTIVARIDLFGSDRTADVEVRTLECGSDDMLVALAVKRAAFEETYNAAIGMVAKQLKQVFETISPF